MSTNLFIKRVYGLAEKIRNIVLNSEELLGQAFTQNFQDLVTL